MNKYFILDNLKSITNSATVDYLKSIEQALNSSSNQHLNTIEQAQLVKQMFARSLRLIANDFSREVDNYTNQIVIVENEKALKEQAKKARQKITTTPKKAEANKKMTLKELRERRAKQLNNNEQKD
jgi:hypothetical protein